jgi:hypothetical protein
VTASLDAKIDDLYQAPLGDFVSARGALAKSLAGADAARVKKLPKPTVVPWAVNQVYWRARAVYDRLLKSGKALREAQVAALGGRKADLRGADEAHRKAIADAVQEAEKIAAAGGSKPPADALMRTFEAVSVATEPVEPHGRLTKPLRPAGFEALAGVRLSPQIVKKVEAKQESAADRKKAEADTRKAEAARKKHEAEIKKAEAALFMARRKMAEAEAALKKKLKR